MRLRDLGVAAGAVGEFTLKSKRAEILRPDLGVAGAVVPLGVLHRFEGDGGTLGHEHGFRNAGNH